MSGTTVGQLGRLLGDRYELLAVIGSGASAEVYHATDTRLGRSVAVKQLRAGYAKDPRFLKLFRAEATLAAQLTHPNIMTVFDWSDDADGSDGGPYLVTQLLPGGTLRSILNEAGPKQDDGSFDRPGTLSASQVGFIGLQAAQGLAFAHEQGLVHRDIKPANLLFGQDGRVHIGDFGIARAVAEAAWTEPEGVLIGTARYAAPEQATDAQIDGLADIYSLTLCLVEALTGSIPLVRENALGTMVQRQRSDVEVGEEWGPLADVLAIGGKARPEDRATSGEFLDAMLAACRELPDPEPLALLDLTDHPSPPADSMLAAARSVAGAGPVEDEAASVRFSDEGDLVILDDGSEIRLAPTDQMRTEIPPRTDEETERPAVPAFAYRGQGGGEPEAAERPGGKRRWPQRMLLTVLLFAIAAGAILGGVLLAESRREYAVIEVTFPTFDVGDYSGQTAVEVEQAVAPLGWAVQASQSYRDGTEVGELLSQNPDPGVRLEPGGEYLIELEYSLGPELRTVPKLLGLTVEEAHAAITAAKLTVGDLSERHDEQVESGLVMAATIGGDEAVPETTFVTGTTIDLLASSGPAPRRVPNVAGLSPANARAAVEKVGLGFAQGSEPSTSVAEGAIIRQSPAGGKFLARGATVTIVVSTGLPFVTVPDVAGMTASSASEALEKAGLRVSGVDGSPLDAAVGTDPAAGQSVRQGTRVTVITAAG